MKSTVLSTAMMLLVIARESISQWSPEDCPTYCICHEFWSDILLMKLNALDCQERDIVNLENVPKNTQALLLKGNTLHIEMLSRQNLSGVQYMDISSNQLKLHQVSALEQLFTQLQTLRALDLSNNYLESLQSGLFKELKSLEFLSLGGNSIVYIERNTFQSLTNLKILKLNDNQLQAINENWFANDILSLRDLDLNSNSINAIQVSNLMYIMQLERLSLSKNNLSYIHPGSFVNSSIQEINLGNNLLAELPNRIISSLTKLAIIKLDNNPIVRLDEHSLFNHSTLRRVSLSNMPYLRIVNENALINLPQLIQIELFQNAKLEFVHPNAFTNCTNVKILFLHGGALRGLDESVKDSLPKLMELSLYDNKIHCNCLAAWLKNSTLNIVDGDKIVCASPHSVKMATLYELSDSQLDVDCSPLVILLSNPSISADFGADVHLECQAIGKATMQWSTPASQTNVSTTPNNRSFTIPMIQHSDQGVYTCVATSSTGESDSASVSIRVVHSEITLTTATISKSFIVLQWDDTGSGTVLSYAASDGIDEEINIPAGINQYTLKKLQPNMGYLICLLYHHRQERSCLTVHMLPESRPDTTSEDSNVDSRRSSTAAHTTTQSILIVFSVIGVLAILAIVLTIFYKKFQRYKHTKIVYSRHEDEITRMDPTPKMEQLYGPTTAPLFGNEQA